jgi:iron complex transport system permease protein
LKRPHAPARSTLLFLAAIVVLAFLIHLGVGSYRWFSPLDVARELLNGPGGTGAESTIVWQIRLPRATACLLVGGILGVVCSAFQAQLRNPLADPYIVGVSSGAAVGGAIAVVTGTSALFGGLGTTLAGFVSGIVSLAVVYFLARRRGVVDVTSLLLAGVVIGSLLSAVLSLILLASGRDQVQVLSWLLGNTGRVPWSANAVLAAALVAGSLVMIRESRRLNAFALGDEAAQRLGVDTVRLTRVVLITGTAMTAAAVGAVGIIGFLGLVAPHISRRLLGVDWRRSLPGSMLVGMGLLILADVLSQRGVSAMTGVVGMEVPVGIVTAILGAPSLLVLMRRKG